MRKYWGSVGKLIDITGQRFGFWVVLKLGAKNTKNQTQWLCKCECGNEKLVTSNSLRTGNSTSCGCNHVPNLANETFGNLTILKLDDSKKNKGRRYWIAKCGCGKLISVTTKQLRNGETLSCGCDKGVSTETSVVLATDIDPSSSIFINAIMQAVQAAIIVIEKSGITAKPDTIAMAIATAASIIVSLKV